MQRSMNNVCIDRFHLSLRNQGYKVTKHTNQLKVELGQHATIAYSNSQSRTEQLASAER